MMQVTAATAMRMSLPAERSVQEFCVVFFTHQFERLCVTFGWVERGVCLFFFASSILAAQIFLSCHCFSSDSALGLAENVPSFRLQQLALSECCAKCEGS
eukprot:m.528461 g.528461  ORF g.528461 m.528461 type:complete len:100 (-) comp57560_c0_seq1:202-501(-)